MNRAERRTHKERMKDKARRLYKDTRCPEKYAEHLAVCSCYMCGNPRRKLKGIDRFTLQERKQGIRNREDLQEFEK